MKLSHFAGLVGLSLLAVEPVFADALCAKCQVTWVDSEDSNNNIRVKATTTVPNSGSCVDKVITIQGSTVSERRRTQMVSLLITSLTTGKPVDINGSSAACESVSIVTLNAK